MKVFFETRIAFARDCVDVRSAQIGGISPYFRLVSLGDIQPA
jgi:hypothetical protein